MDKFRLEKMTDIPVEDYARRVERLSTAIGKEGVGEDLRHFALGSIYALQEENPETATAVRETKRSSG